MSLLLRCGAVMIFLGGFCGVAEASGQAEHRLCPLAKAGASVELKLFGQDVFAAISEVKEVLEADPDTDWSQVNLDSLRNHLVDMNRVMIDAEVEARPIPRGFEASIRGRGKTLASIRRMIPAHVRMMNQLGDSFAETVALGPDQEFADRGGLLLRVTVSAEDVEAVQRLRGLGLYGFLVDGDHHRVHHLAMALGSAHHMSSGATGQ